MFAERAAEAYEALRGVPGIRVNPTRGAFYMTVLFEPGALNGENRLSIADQRLRETVEQQCKGAAPDARFVYHLLGSTGICVVPLSGFYSPHAGFRFTLLETDDAKRARIFRSLAEALTDYVESGRNAA
jgi:aspartate/methionine/tyrosine aminotransferase